MQKSVIFKWSFFSIIEHVCHVQKVKYENWHVFWLAGGHLGHTLYVLATDIFLISMVLAHMPLH